MCVVLFDFRICIVLECDSLLPFNHCILVVEAVALDKFFTIFVIPLSLALSRFYDYLLSYPKHWL